MHTLVYVHAWCAGAADMRPLGTTLQRSHYRASSSKQDCHCLYETGHRIRTIAMDSPLSIEDEPCHNKASAPALGTTFPMILEKTS